MHIFCTFTIVTLFYEKSNFAFHNQIIRNIVSKDGILCVADAEVKGDEVLDASINNYGISGFTDKETEEMFMSVISEIEFDYSEGNIFMYIGCLEEKKYISKNVAEVLKLLKFPTPK